MVRNKEALECFLFCLSQSHTSSIFAISFKLLLNRTEHNRMERSFKNEKKRRVDIPSKEEERGDLKERMG